MLYSATHNYKNMNGYGCLKLSLWTLQMLHIYIGLNEIKLQEWKKWKVRNVKERSGNMKDKNVKRKKESLE